MSSGSETVVGDGGVLVDGEELDPVEEEVLRVSRERPKGKRKRGVESVAVARGVRESVDCSGEYYKVELESLAASERAKEVRTTYRPPTTPRSTPLPLPLPHQRLIPPHTRSPPQLPHFLLRLLPLIFLQHLHLPLLLPPPRLPPAPQLLIRQRLLSLDLLPHERPPFHQNLAAAGGGGLPTCESEGREGFEGRLGDRGAALDLRLNVGMGLLRRRWEMDGESWRTVICLRCQMEGRSRGGGERGGLDERRRGGGGGKSQREGGGGRRAAERLPQPSAHLASAPSALVRLGGIFPLPPSAEVG